MSRPRLRQDLVAWLTVWLGRQFPHVPGALVVSAIAIGVAWVANVGAWSVALVGPVPSGVPMPM